MRKCMTSCSTNRVSQRQEYVSVLSRRPRLCVAALYVMPHKRRIAVAAFVAVFLLLWGLSWFCGRLEPTGHKLRFESGNFSINPLFVLITRGRLETNYSPAPVVNVGRVYIHTFYSASQESCQPVSALSYRLRWWVAPVLGRLVARDKFCGGMTGTAHPHRYASPLARLPGNEQHTVLGRGVGVRSGIACATNSKRGAGGKCSTRTSRFLAVAHATYQP